MWNSALKHVWIQVVSDCLNNVEMREFVIGVIAEVFAFRAHIFFCCMICSSLDILSFVICLVI